MRWHGSRFTQLLHGWQCKARCKVPICQPSSVAGGIRRLCPNGEALQPNVFGQFGERCDQRWRHIRCPGVDVVQEATKLSRSDVPHENYRDLPSAVSLWSGEYILGETFGFILNLQLIGLENVFHHFYPEFHQGQIKSGFQCNKYCNNNI